MIYYLARHGQDEANAQGLLNGRIDTPLTALGIKQVHSLAHKMKKKDIKIEVIYSSPLARSLKTAQIISDLCGFRKPIVNRLLTERDFGFMTNKKISDIETLCTPHVMKTKTCTYFLEADGAESFPELVQRAKTFWGSVNTKKDFKKCLLVTHGDIGKALYAAYYNMYWKNVLKLFHFGNAELILLSHNPKKKKMIKAHQYNL